VSLLALPDGGLLAGGSGDGLVYRIDTSGHGFVLYAGDMPQVAALTAVGAGMAGVVKSSANLQDALNQLEAVSGASADEMVRLRQEALRLGSTTQYTAGQAAGGPKGGP